jgi:hypothetical protein
MLMLTVFAVHVEVINSMAQTEKQKEAFRKMGHELDDELRELAEADAPRNIEEVFPVEDAEPKMSRTLSKFPDELDANSKE